MLVNLGALVYYIFCAKYQHPVLNAFTVLFHLLVVADLVILAFKDPGIIPKILVSY
jgi:hypothetical protein